MTVESRYFQWNWKTKKGNQVTAKSKFYSNTSVKKPPRSSVVSQFAFPPGKQWLIHAEVYSIACASGRKLALEQLQLGLGILSVAVVGGSAALHAKPFLNPWIPAKLGMFHLAQRSNLLEERFPQETRRDRIDQPLCSA